MTMGMTMKIEFGRLTVAFILGHLVAGIKL